MAINNKDLVLFENEFEVDDIREMGELEIAGAIAYTNSILKDLELENFGERITSFDSINGSAYYCGMKLHLNNNTGYIIDYQDGKDLVLDHLFMRENSMDTLWGFAYWNDVETDEESEMFLVRI